MVDNETKVLSIKFSHYTSIEFSFGGLVSGWNLLPEGINVARRKLRGWRVSSRSRSRRIRCLDDGATVG